MGGRQPPRAPRVWPARGEAAPLSAPGTGPSSPRPSPAHARSVCDVSPCSCRFEAFAYFSVSNDDLSISEDSGLSVSRS